MSMSKIQPQRSVRRGTQLLNYQILTTDLRGTLNMGARQSSGIMPIPIWELYFFSLVQEAIESSKCGN